MSEHPILAAIRRCPPGLQAEKAQSEEIDRDLGLDCQTIEHALIKRARQHSQSEDFRDWGPALHGQDYQTWVGLPVQSLMTPYAEILRMLESLAPLPGSMLTDLGAGYGRLSYITSLRFPDSRCLSFEYVTERVHEGNRVYGALLPQGFHLQGRCGQRARKRRWQGHLLQPFSEYIGPRRTVRHCPAATDSYLRCLPA